MQNRPAIKICYFNMIEVVLAMAIIAFGMSSILGLFPVGLNALKSSMADNYCSDAIDQMVGYIKNQAEYTPAAYSDAKYQALINNTNCLPTAAALTTALGASRSNVVNGSTLDGFRDTFLGDYRTGNFVTGTSQFNRVFTDMNIFQVQSPPVAAPMPYLYFIVQGQITSKNIDFSAMLLVWKSPVTYNVKDSSGGVSQRTDTTYANLAGINFEVSWPLEKPYAQREKRYYYVEVKRP